MWAHSSFCEMKMIWIKHWSITSWWSRNNNNLQDRQIASLPKLFHRKAPHQCRAFPLHNSIIDCRGVSMMPGTDPEPWWYSNDCYYSNDLATWYPSENVLFAPSKTQKRKIALLRTLVKQLVPYYQKLKGGIRIALDSIPAAALTISNDKTGLQLHVPPNLYHL